MTTRAEALEALARCSNAGRWGADDQLGTLNLITPDKRRRAARLVREGVCVSLGGDIDTVQRPLNPHPARHLMHLERDLPDTLHDSIALDVHGVGTHLDAVGHVYVDGIGYNGRRQDEVVTNDGLLANGICAMREGIFTRGVLLDVAAAAEVHWLEADRTVTAADLRSAETLAGVDVEPGDAVFVHTGLERRAAPGDPADLVARAGLGLDAVYWLRDRDIAVYSGDCVERLPISGPVLPLPLHQIGIAAMGLALLDWPRLTGLLAACAHYGRAEFLLTVAPLRIPGGTGSPVNPVATF
ncbi:cyclase family protein [Geodermatophilus amargosae]|uniref:cyclase family protein n=1 Tax=Geodermatophilus amargosae TaxID=1296565 RepID=UPI0034DE7AE2